jgi:hypothetical protein
VGKIQTESTWVSSKKKQLEKEQREQQVESFKRKQVESSKRKQVESSKRKQVESSKRKQLVKQIIYEPKKAERNHGEKVLRESSFCRDYMKKTRRERKRREEKRERDRKTQREPKITSIF